MFIFSTVIILTILMITICLIIKSPGKMKPFLDKIGQNLKGSISEKVYTNINGVKMGMIIKSKNSNNPVLLFVHGGAGMPEYPLTQNHPTGLDEYFTVVWWDQRDAGLSFHSDTKADTMTTKQFVSDTIEISKYLQKLFGQKKIYLMGHSWGSYIAIQVAAKAPELYHAYIGMGQMVNQMESEQLAYEYMLKYYTKTGDKKTVKKLEAIHLESKNCLPAEYDKIRDSVMHRAGIGTMHKMKSVVSGIFLPVMLNEEYTLSQKINIWRGRIYAKSTVLNREANKMDFRKYIKKLDIPVYFFSGKYDYTVNHTMAEAYLKQLDAPLKGFYSFQNSAHSPIFEEPVKVIKIMREDVLNGKNDLANVR